MRVTVLITVAAIGMLVVGFSPCDAGCVDLGTGRRMRMSGAAEISVRDLRLEDRDAALEVLIDAFLEVEFPPADRRLLFGTGRGLGAERGVATG